MDPELPFVVAIVAILTWGVVTIARAFINRQRNSSLAPGALTGIENRLTRIEQSVDAIAVEIERVSEGQRFTTRLLADRTDSGADAAVGVPRRPGGAV